MNEVVVSFLFYTIELKMKYEYGKLNIMFAVVCMPQYTNTNTMLMSVFVILYLPRINFAHIKGFSCKTFPSDKNISYLLSSNIIKTVR